MSLSDLEEYERQQAIRREKIKTVLRWAPLGLATVLVAASGLSVWSASSGHEEDFRAIDSLIAEKKSDAEEAEASLHESWTAAVTDSSAVNPDRVEADSTAFGDILIASIEDGTDQSEKLPEKGNFASFLDDINTRGIPGVDGPVKISGFDPVLTGIDGTVYTWQTVVALTPADGEEPAAWFIVTWSMDDAGTVTNGTAVWADSAPKSS